MLMTEVIPVWLISYLCVQVRAHRPALLSGVSKGQAAHRAAPVFIRVKGQYTGRKHSFYFIFLDFIRREYLQWFLGPHVSNKYIFICRTWVEKHHGKWYMKYVKTYSSHMENIIDICIQKSTFVLQEQIQWNKLYLQDKLLSFVKHSSLKNLDAVSFDSQWFLGTDFKIFPKHK